MGGKVDSDGATSREHLLTLVQRRGTAKKALACFTHQAAAMVRNVSVKSTVLAVLSLVNAAVERRQPEWTQALTVERDSKRQRVTDSSRNDVVFAAKIAQSIVKVYAPTNAAAAKAKGRYTALPSLFHLMPMNTIITVRLYWCIIFFCRVGGFGDGDGSGMCGAVRGVCVGACSASRRPRGGQSALPSGQEVRGDAEGE